MKALFSISFLVLMLLQVGYRPVVVLDWKINQEIITLRYCVNKERPAMHCDGKCYLAKQLKKLDVAEQRERADHALPEQKLKQCELLLVNIIPDLMPQIPKYLSLAATSAPDHYTADYRFDYLKFCFHPPEVFPADCLL